MKSKIFLPFFLFILLSSCKNKERPSNVNIIFLHHSTGEVIWKGNNTCEVINTINKLAGRFNIKLNSRAQLPSLIKDYNKKHNKNYQIKEMVFPKISPYGWKNFPFDYYNIWVRNAGEEAFMEEPTLEILTKEYQVIIFKHCFPVSNIHSEIDTPCIDSEIKTISNYKLQYIALRNKLLEFPESKFILFTGAALVQSAVSEYEALRAREFFRWVTDEWDVPGDNIYLWDFYSIETEGSLYFKNEYAVSSDNSHPNREFAGKAVNLLFNRIIDVIENNGSSTLLTGKQK